MTSSKRSKVDIYSSILEVLIEEGAKQGKASPTRVSRRANIPYDRFQKIIDHLIEVDMVQRTDEGLMITEKGLNCLRQIRKTNEVLRRMGLSI
ncbi:MAG TPA: winged helix-turn-helix domain-containing protein [Candidatus Acidoferrales bacterium]|nr:winged helix-turn-helix domain-containing protein [Candidatus Acidoferrales bacterium]